MSLFSGTRLTDRDIDHQTQKRIRLIVKRFGNGEIDEPDANRQLIDLLVKALNAKAQIPGHLTRWQIWGDNDNCRAVDPDGDWVKYADVIKPKTRTPGREGEQS